MSTINPDGSPVLIEAVYARYGVVEAEPCDSVDDALAFLQWGADDGRCAAIGVFVDGEPRVAAPYVDPHPPSAAESAALRTEYVRVRRRS